MAELRDRAPRRVLFRLTPGDTIAAIPNGEFQSGDSIDGRVTGTWVGSSSEMLDWLRSMHVTDLEIGPPTMEELFHRLYRDDAGKPSEGDVACGRSR